MDTAVLQELLTINVQDGLTSLTQSAHQYLDIGQNEDLVFYLDVRNVSGSVLIAYETSPTQQDSSFLPMIAPVPIIGTGLKVDRAAFSTAAVPPARFVRWKLTCLGGAWNVTFRVWLAAYAYC